MSQDATTRPIRVLIVDDSAFMRAALSRMITSEDGLEVAGTALCGSDALDKISSLDPDVVTLDVEMPGRDGIDATKDVVRLCPATKVIIFTAHAQPDPRDLRDLPSIVERLSQDGQFVRRPRQRGNPENGSIRPHG